MFFSNVVNKILTGLRITRHPAVKVYDGYGDQDEIIIYGHVLKISPLPRKRYRNNVFINIFALLRLFMIVPKKNARVILDWNGELHETTTESDGLFKFEWKPTAKVTPGWHTVKVKYVTKGENPILIASGEGIVFIPHEYQFNFISDIDDTFLVSHSNSIFKRLYVLFTNNARSRKPFEGVANHYRLLSMAHVSDGIPNPFFYVSSSEWNLYYYIREFARKENMPRGIFLLNQIKRFRDLLKTGQGKHQGKYVRIVRILKSYPDHKYVLLGDNSQSDPEIYYKVVRDFPGKIFAVYLRNVSPLKAESTKGFIKQIEAGGVHCCYFVHSREAIIHSKLLGLIDPDA
jgi:phosphatidate phosphatase APP1